MPRTARSVESGLIYHVLNRGNGRQRLFRTHADYDAFLCVLAEAMARFPSIELLAFCLMPNHWHLICRPKHDADLAAFMSWLTNTHVKRYRAHYRRTSGHLYQGRYKSFPVERDEHLLIVLRYVEANALRAKIVRRAQDWPYSSLVTSTNPQIADGSLSDWPIERPGDWLAIVNELQPDAIVQRVRTSIVRDRPFGSDRWIKHTAATMGLAHTLHPQGRPRKRPTAKGK